MKRLLILVLLLVYVFISVDKAEAFVKGESAVSIGQTYYITGRDVWIRDEPNTNVPAVATYRFGEPVVLLGVEGDWAHVKLVNGWDRYVHMNYVDTKEIVQSKLKATTECMLTLDRIYDDVERLMESMYPNGPGEKAPKPEARKSACDAFMGRLAALDRQLDDTGMADAARNDIKNLAARVSVLINHLQNWENGGQEKYTPYFLDEFMPEYERVGGLYR